MTFYLIFTNDLDLSGRYIVENYARFGASDTLELTIPIVIAVGIAFIFYIFLISVRKLGKSKSIIPVVLLNGSANVIGEMPIMFSKLGVSLLLGPNPMGIIGISVLLKKIKQKHRGK